MVFEANTITVKTFVSHDKDAWGKYFASIPWDVHVADLVSLTFTYSCFQTAELFISLLAAGEKRVKSLSSNWLRDNPIL